MTLPRTADASAASSRLRQIATSPITILGAALLVVCALLAVPLSLAIGPSYWDVYQYYDAANRIFSGQVPANDFFIPAGPLGYYLVAAWLTVFPNGQPALLAQWSTLAITAPLIGLVVWDAGKRSRVTAFALLLPFLFFALLPFNTHEYYPFPGTDAFGTYNRQVCQLLYIIVAAFVFMRNRRLQGVVIAIGMSALFFIKVTGFVAAGIVCLFALLTGRINWRYFAAALTAFLLLLAGLQVTTGIVGSYLKDILILVQLNSGTLLPRFLQSASFNFGLLMPAGLLALLLLWKDRRALSAAARSAVRNRSVARTSAVLDHPGLWLLVVLFAGVLSETQNLGSQGLIFLWPVCLLILTRIRRFSARPVTTVATVTLVAAAMLPPAVAVSERAARAFVGSSHNVPLANHNLKSLGAVNMRPDIALRVKHMLDFYPSHRATYNDFVAMGELPTPLFFFDPDFQVTYLATVDKAIDSIYRLEADKGVRFDSILQLSNYNPFPWLMDRTAPRTLSIAADPLRTVPAPGPVEQQAVADTDLVLYPTCPPTILNVKLLKLYSEGLANHRRIKLNECYDAFVHPRFGIG